jgi:cardiolipin synthase
MIAVLAQELLSMNSKIFIQKKLTLATMLTVLRIVLIPFIVSAMIEEQWTVAFSLFFIAMVTDAVDGSLARWRNEQTFFGACLDPIADKLLLVSCFFTFAFVKTPLFTIPSWFFWIVFVKELLLVFGALFLFYRKGFVEIRAAAIGKIAAGMQMLFVVWFFVCHFFGFAPVKTYACLLWVVLFFVLAALVYYVYIAMKFLVRIGLFHQDNE